MRLASFLSKTLCALLVALALTGAATKAWAEPVEEPRLGLMIEDVTPEMAARRGILPYGVLVRRLMRMNGAASTPGLLVNDQIMTFDGKPATAEMILARLARAEPGETFMLMIERTERRSSVMVKVRQPADPRTPFFGATFETVDASAGGPGVRVTALELQGAAKQAGLEIGDVLTKIDETPLRSAEQADATIQTYKAGDTVKISTMRDGVARVVEAPLVGWPRRVVTTKPKLYLETNGHAGPITALTLRRFGSDVITAGEDGTIRIWDSRTGRQRNVLRLPQAAETGGEVSALAVSPNGRYLAVAGRFRAQGGATAKILILNYSNGDVHAVLEGHRTTALAIVFDARSRGLLSSSYGGELAYWDIRSAAKRWSVKAHDGPIEALATTRFGNLAVTGGWDGKIRIWNVRTGQPTGEPLLGHQSKIRSIAIGRSSRVFFSGDDKGEIRQWNLRQRRAMGVFANLGGRIGALAHASNRNYLLATCASKACRWEQVVFNSTNRREVSRFKQHRSYVLAAGLGWRDQVATASGAGGPLFFWNSRTGRANRTPSVRGDGDSIYAVGVSAEGDRIGWGLTWTGGDWRNNAPIQQWITVPKTGGFRAAEAPKSTEGDTAAIGFSRALLAHDGVAAQHERGGPQGAADAVLVLKRGETELARITRGVNDGNGHYAYTLTKDDRVISGGAAGLIFAYDFTGKKVGEFVGHAGRVWSVAISQDGKRLVTGGEDQTIRIWNAESYELLATIYPIVDGSYVIWTPAGYFSFYSPELGRGAVSIERKIGWVLNYGLAERPRYVRAFQFRRQFNRPDLVIRTIMLGSGKAAQDEALKPATEGGAARTAPDLLKLIAR